MSRAVSCAALALAACGIDAVGSRVEGASTSGSSSGAVDVDGGGDPGGVDAGSTTDAASGDATTDATLGDPPVPALPLDAKAACGRPSVYVDDFTDGIPSTVFNVNAPGGTITEQNGTLVVAYAAGAVSSYSARAMVNLRDDRLRIAVTTPPSATGRAVIGLRYDDSHVLSFILAGGTLNARLVDNGAASNATATFDPVAHRWWQIVESGGTTRWETSPDGIAWNTLVSRTTPSWVTTVRPFVSAGDDGGAGPAGEVRFARLNSGRPAGDWCKLSSFSDAFEDGQMSRFWESFQSGACSGGESSGELRFAIGAAKGHCGWRSNVAYDLTSSAAYIEVPNISSYHPQVKFSLRVIDIASDGVAELAFVGSNELAENASGIAPMTTAYGGSSEDWWRLRESAGMLSWEASGNGTAWVEKRKSAVPFALTAVKVAIGGEATAAMPGAISIGTPRFNVGP